MSIVRSLGLVVIGLAIGVLITRPIRAVEVQNGSSESRLVFSNVRANGQNSELVFVKDLRTSGCWLAVQTRQSVVSLAVAPTEACSFK
jgi:hypothetical protein